jgi:hypothetical protein
MKKSDLTITTHHPFQMGTLEEKSPEITLKLGCKVLEGLGFKYWLSAGTALGIHRDKRFIPHDTDIDVGVTFDWEDPAILSKTRKLLAEMQQKGLILVQSVVAGNRPMQLAYINPTNYFVLFDIYFYYQGVEKEILVNYNSEGILRKPSNFVNALGELSFAGVGYPCPSPIEEYLAYRYGSTWRTPEKHKDDWVDHAPYLERWSS